jgi:hypothetical protein
VIRNYRVDEIGNPDVPLLTAEERHFVNFTARTTKFARRAHLRWAIAAVVRSAEYRLVIYDDDDANPDGSSAKNPEYVDCPRVIGSLDLFYNPRFNYVFTKPKAAAAEAP